MKYVLLIYGTEEDFSTAPADELEARYAEYMAISEAPGVVGGAQLKPVATATSVRVRGGETLTTDGPFAETKEVLGGYYLFEADNLDDAIAIAARIPAARHGSVEVRPLVEH